MMPIAPLMIEHRLIERMVRRIGLERLKLQRGGELDAVFLLEAIDFMRAYADRCHHGKEEDILFSELERRPMSAELKRTMEGLAQEHVLARELVSKMAELREQYLGGDEFAAEKAANVLGRIADLYPKHIEKEDKEFFLPVMELFTKEDQATMLERFYEFDRNLIHERYQRLVNKWEKN